VPLCVLGLAIARMVRYLRTGLGITRYG